MILRHRNITVKSEESCLITDGLITIIGKEFRLTTGIHDNDSYIEVLKYLIDYCIIAQPVMKPLQNIGYYSWLLQLRSEDEHYFDLFEANADGSGFNNGCETVISAVGSQSEICFQYGLIPQFPSFNQVIVISDGVYEGKDIEGIRYGDLPPDQCGWYLITDDYNDDIKSLKMVHFYHVVFARPDIVKYLALPFGYRFLMKDNSVEIIQDEEE